MELKLLDTDQVYIYWLSEQAKLTTRQWVEEFDKARATSNVCTDRADAYQAIIEQMREASK